jgi:hypothetical protein
MKLPYFYLFKYRSNSELEYYAKLIIYKTKTCITNPFPSIGATIHKLKGPFKWEPVQGVAGYDLYLGKDTSEPFQKLPIIWRFHQCYSQ